MDYKYIEQLLERYWACETSPEEEQILRTFFRQKEVPAHLLPYKNLFAYEDAMQNVHLNGDFDERVLSLVERPTVKIRHIQTRNRMMPLFKAAAMITIMPRWEELHNTRSSTTGRQTTTTMPTKILIQTLNRPTEQYPKHCRPYLKVYKNHKSTVATA